MSEIEFLLLSGKADRPTPCQIPLIENDNNTYEAIIMPTIRDDESGLKLRRNR
jgi:hypothetical protein